MDKRKDIWCADCGIFLPNVALNRKRCPECAKKRNLEQIRAAKLRCRTGAVHREVPKRSPCAGCFYYGGSFPSNYCCNYLLTEGHRRPCPPGEGCTARKE